MKSNKPFKDYFDNIYEACKQRKIELFKEYPELSSNVKRRLYGKVFHTRNQSQEELVSYLKMHYKELYINLSKEIETENEAENQTITESEIE